MARAYRHTVSRRVLNRVVRLLVRFDLMPGPRYLLTVEGRKSGLPRSTPVTLVEQEGARWLVAPYGEVGWVKNARGVGIVELSRGRRVETARVREVHLEEAAPVLKMYAERVLHTRPYFGAPPSAATEAFAPDAHRCPVFRLLGDDLGAWSPAASWTSCSRRHFDHSKPAILRWCDLWEVPGRRPARVPACQRVTERPATATVTLPLLWCGEQDSIRALMAFAMG